MVWKVGIAGRGKDVVVDAEGRALVAGWIGGDQQDAWVAAYDSGGEPLWEDVVVVGPLDQAATAAMVATTGAYVVAGYDLIDQVGGSSEERRESWVHQYSVDGTSEWTVQFSHETYWVSEVPITLGEEADGQFVLVSERREGATYFGGLRGIGPTGDVKLSTEVAWDDDDPGFAPHAGGGALVPANPSEAIVVGSFYPDRWAVRVDQAGGIVWTEQWPCATDCPPLTDIAAKQDGTFVIAGALPDQEGTRDPWVGSMGGDGTLNWQTTWGMPGVWEGASEVAIAADGTILVMGGTSLPMNESVGWIRKLSPEGDLIWETMLESERVSGEVSLTAVATGGECGGIWVAGSATGEGEFLVLVAP